MNYFRSASHWTQNSGAMPYSSTASAAPSVRAMGSGPYYPNGGNTYYPDSGAYVPQYAKQVWYKCPFCGHRQNIDKDGAHCKACCGDVMIEGVR
jgi:hypothetical protein